MRVLPPRSVCRLPVAVAAAFVLIVATAAPARAHTISGPKPTNYRTRVLSITPEAPGVTVRLLDDARIELTNRTSTEVLVLGYEGEPYLRVGPDGVFENLHSAATYMNRSTRGGAAPPGIDTSPTAPPDWRKASSGRTARWHDHRLHWMQAGLPPQVARAPDRYHRIRAGRVQFVHAGTTTDVAVLLEWVPGPSGLPWIPAGAAAFAVGAVCAAARRRGRLAAALVGVLVAADAAHAISYELDRPGGATARLVQFAGENFVSIVVWAVAAATIVGLARERVLARYGAILVGVLVALVGGATDLSSLWKSQLPIAGPAVLARLEVVLALGLGGGLAAGAAVWLATRRVPPQEQAAPPGPWLGALVAGLDDAELRHVAAALDVDEVLGIAMPELAARMGAAATDLRAGALVVEIVTDDTAGRRTYSLVARDAGVAVHEGRAEPVSAELTVSFPQLLRMLGGTTTVGDAVAAGRAAISGDRSVLGALAPYFAEQRERTKW
jgi:hypothetical protein